MSLVVYYAVCDLTVNDNVICTTAILLLLTAPTPQSHGDIGRRSGSTVVSINEVKLRRDWLVQNMGDCVRVQFPVRDIYLGM